MALLVQKFGGTSVADVERIQAVARRIARSREEGHELVIVVSAMGHTTDQLTGLAQLIGADIKRPRNIQPRQSHKPDVARGRQCITAVLQHQTEIPVTDLQTYGARRSSTDRKSVV
jgi:aspartokinase